MGIDLDKHHVRKTIRKAPVGKDLYRKTLHSLYSYLARRTNSKFCKIVLKRLSHSKSNMQPVSLSKLVLNNKEGKILVAVTKITNDERLEKLPSMTVAAYKFSRTAKSRIIEAGGEAILLDELILRSPKGSNTILLRGKRKNRTVYKHFGAVCSKDSPALPKVRSKGRKFEACK